jgi:hypothetical protein
MGVVASCIATERPFAFFAFDARTLLPVHSGGLSNLSRSSNERHIDACVPPVNLNESQQAFPKRFLGFCCSLCWDTEFRLSGFMKPENRETGTCFYTELWYIIMLVYANKLAWGAPSQGPNHKLALVSKRKS